MRLGCVTYNLLKDSDVDTIIQKLQTAGWEAVELRTGHKHGVEPSLGPDERKRVRQRFQTSGVRLLSFGTTTRFQSADAAERKKQVEIAKQFVDLAHDTGALGIKIQPLGFAKGVSKEATVDYYAAALRELGDYGRSKKVEIWVEVHGRDTSDPPFNAAMMKAAAHDNVGLCWNSNPTDINNGSVRESFALLKPWIRNVHIHELSDPAYPYRELFTLLREAGYNRYTLAEVGDSKEPDRYMQNYKALWTEMTRSCS